jgi:NADH-quinone oxidoreductase subunit D
MRLLLELDGERIINCVPDIGFLHTGIEKNMEAKTYEQALVMTDRMDYLNNLGNNLCYCLAVEKLVDLDVPPRARVARVLLTELTRIASHLLWLGTHALDLAAITVFWYTWREREILLDIFEMCSGQRMMTSYFRPGGLWRDLPGGFEQAVRDFIRIFPGRLEQYASLLSENPLYLERAKQIGVITADEAIRIGLTGPNLRASGLALDMRVDQPYSGYEDFDFEVPTATHGDTYDRYIVRMEEMRQSLRIVEQALDRMPEGPFRSNNRKFVPPPRSELGRSMEAVIHHFKLWTEGFSAPAGAVFLPVESPRGVLACYLEGDGGPTPHRVHFRTPSFANLQALPFMARGHLVADLVAIISSLDPIMGDVDR